MATAVEILRAAGAIIERGGWSQGAEARDSNGVPVPLVGGSERWSINPAAVSFSIFGAVRKAIAEAAGRVERLPLVFDVLFRLAYDVNGHPLGGTNYVHPLLQFNEAAGRTKDEVLALIELAAHDCERIGDAPFPPPVTADPNLVEQL